MDFTISTYAWIIPLFPFVSFLILLVLGRQMKGIASTISIFAMLLATVSALLLLGETLKNEAQSYTSSVFNWLDIGDFSISFGYEVNNVNVLMLVIVTVVSLLVNVFSKGYMADDERMTVFYSYISLFTFSMLMLVISDNILQLYIFWELVGLCSFLLIGFWYQKKEAKAAAKKAFIVTRIGDIGLFIAVILLFWYMPEHMLSFTAIHNAFETNAHGFSDGMVTLVALLIFVGAVGKSGQFPLHTWLPDAMEGPTPISALIHAATMVAAGVFLVAKTYDIFLASETALLIVGTVGAFTALFAALIAIAQNDIKRILAYSTVSQLGYMMLALGLGTMAAYSAAMLHLFTHAFFKALLFLGAGSIIYALHHEQNILKMGGIGKSMKVTTWTFAIGTLALAGIFPLSGFWSKDAILAQAYEHQPVFFAAALIGVFLTAFYMSRLFFLVFTGDNRSGHTPKESPWVMTLPLIILAVLAVCAGWVAIPGIGTFNEWLVGETMEEKIHWSILIISNVVALLGIGLGYKMFRNKTASSLHEQSGNGLQTVLARKFYIDELYDLIVVKPVRGLGAFLQLWDEFIVGGLVKGSITTTRQIGKMGMRLQSGQMQVYALISVIGMLILLLIFAGRRLI
ncbi:NADH-quinone oxidoreductase subunit L [Longirhabdus pacifica]|uniref:NADH-quinone oxidoreductase subunit L n=1 Tax=Longirhabdus pacifica TaxID=2305227 RepID=UPI0010090E5A|nr:NADH-quinone oxidoreductase subunit L [Longirhabdus pacifica]